MSRNLWWKGALLVLATGTTLGLGLADGCMANMVQRILVAVAFD